MTALADGLAAAALCWAAAVATAGRRQSARAGDWLLLALAALAAGAAVVLLACLEGTDALAPADAALVALWGAAAVADLRTMRIPNVLSAAALGAAALGVALSPEPAWRLAAAGALVVTAPALVAWRIGGMGLGDVKLLVGTGAALGPVLGPCAFALAALLGGLRARLGGRPGRTPGRFAFAPFIALAATVCLMAPHLVVFVLSVGTR